MTSRMAGDATSCDLLRGAEPAQPRGAGWQVHHCRKRLSALGLRCVDSLATRGEAVLVVGSWTRIRGPAVPAARSGSGERVTGELWYGAGACDPHGGAARRGGDATGGAG